jgi:hypothetical protein
MEIRDRLAPDTRRTIEARLSAAIARPSLDFIFDVPGAPIRVHYNTTGIHAVLNATTDTAADGVPTYVHIAGDALKRGYDLLLDSIGFAPPLTDDTSGGGNDLFDCYLSIPAVGGSSTIAFTTIDTLYDYWRIFGSQSEDSVYVAASFIVVHPTMAPFIQLPDPLDLLRITCAHEFFHIFHYDLDADENPLSFLPGWWIEGTATWLEDVAYPDINDWTNVDAYLQQPYRSLTSALSQSDLHPYGAGSVWTFYLVERFGGQDIVRNIWQRCGRYRGDNTFTATAENLPLGVSLNDAWHEFSTWCMRTGSRWDDSSFEQGFMWPEALTDTAIVLYQYPSAVHVTDGADTLDQLLDSTIPVLTISPSQRRLEALGFLSVPLISFPTRSSEFNMAVFADTSVPVEFTFVGVNNLGVSDIVEYGTLAGGDTTLIANWLFYDTLLAVASVGLYHDIVGSDTSIGDRTAFLIAALDTSAAVAEPITFDPPFPNPVSFDAGSGAHFRLVLTSPATVYLDVFTLSGDRVRSITRPDAVNFVDIEWDGRNDGGKTVAAGLYMCKLSAGGAEKVFRVGVLR